MSDKKEMILDVAENLFSEHGYEGTSTRMLAKDAGVNIAMISYYFGSKEKLFEAMVARRASAIREQITQIAQRDISPDAKLNAVIDLYVEKVLSNHCYHKIIHRELSLQQRTGMTDAVTDILLLNMKAILGILREGQAKGLYREADLEMTLASFFGTIFHIVNSSDLTTKFLRNSDPESVITPESIKVRLKNHLKALMSNHLRVQTVHH